MNKYKEPRQSIARRLRIDVVDWLAGSTMRNPVPVFSNLSNLLCQIRVTTFREGVQHFCEGTSLECFKTVSNCTENQRMSDAGKFSLELFGQEPPNGRFKNRKHHDDREVIQWRPCQFCIGDNLCSIQASQLVIAFDMFPMFTRDSCESLSRRTRGVVPLPDFIDRIHCRI